MNFDSVLAWLKQQTNRQIRHRYWLAILGLILAPLAFVVAALMIYGFLRAFDIHYYNDEHRTQCFWITIGLIALLFIINLFTPRTYGPEKYYHEDSEDDDYPSFGSRQRAKQKVLLWIILAGPRLVDWAIFSFREIARLKGQDTHSCAAMLWVMMVKRTKVPYEDFSRELDWLDLETTLPQLKCIPGVLFLKTPPPGLSLNEDLRNAIRSGESI